MKRKRIIVLPLLLAFTFFLMGCNKVPSEEKLRDVDYTVIGETDIPQELSEEIEKLKETEFQLSYDDGEYTYIAKGYGKRNTGGYNISVLELYETKHALVLKTEITGPTEGEDVSKKATYPYVVIKTEQTRKSLTLAQESATMFQMRFAERDHI